MCFWGKDKGPQGVLTSAYLYAKMHVFINRGYAHQSRNLWIWDVRMASKCTDFKSLKTLTTDINHGNCLWLNFTKRLFNKISLLFVDRQSFGNFDWFPSLGPQPLNSMDSKHFSNQLKFIQFLVLVSFWPSKCPFFTKERCRKPCFQWRTETIHIGWRCSNQVFQDSAFWPTELQLHWM